MIKPDIVIRLEKYASYKCDKGCIYKHPSGTFIVKYLEVNGAISHTLQYRTTTSFLWTLGNIRNFLHIYHPDMRIEPVSVRRYGEPKLVKPKELKGIPQTFGIPYIYGGYGNVKATNSVFIKGDDIYIKVRDYMSRTFRPPAGFAGAPLNVILANFFPDKVIKQKFIYSDCYGSVVLRGEAWLCFRHIMPLILKESILISQSTLVALSQKIPGLYAEWKFFCEDLISKIKNEYAQPDMPACLKTFNNETKHELQKNDAPPTDFHQKTET